MLDRLIFGLMDFCLAWRYRGEKRKLRFRARPFPDADLSIAAPKTANCKFVWRKVFDHDPRFTVVSDKLAAKQFVEELGIGVKVPATLWAGLARDFPAKYLQADVAIKSNHGWRNSLFPKRDGLSIQEVNDGIDAAMAQKHGRKTNEWGYFGIRPMIFVEERVDIDAPLLDLKVYTFGPRILHVTQIRTNKSQQRVGAVWFPDGGGSFVRSDVPSPVSPEEVDDAPLTERIDEASAVATAIGTYFDHMRIDFLISNNQLYLGEITVYSLSGHIAGGSSESADSSVIWDLRRSWFLNTDHKGWKRLYAHSLRRFCDREAEKLPDLNAAGPLSQEDFARSMEIAERLLADETFTQPHQDTGNCGKN